MLALRRLAEALEAAQEAAARRQGWSWQEIAAALEVSERAVHRKYAGRVPARARHGPEEVRVFEWLIEEAREVVWQGHDESSSAGVGHVGTEHLLLGLMAPRAGLAREVLLEAGWRPTACAGRSLLRRPRHRVLFWDRTTRRRSWTSEPTLMW